MRSTVHLLFIFKYTLLSIFLFAACRQERGPSVALHNLPGSKKFERYKKEFIESVEIVLKDNQGRLLTSPILTFPLFPEKASPDGVSRYTVEFLKNNKTAIQIQEAGGALETVMVIGDIDPGSGPAFRMDWSQDSRAVFIVGEGGLIGSKLSKFAIIYSLDDRQLYRINFDEVIERKTVSGRALELEQRD